MNTNIPIISDKRQKLNLLYEIVMALLALIVLSILVMEYTTPLTEQQLDYFAKIDISILLVFAVDYFYRLFKAQNKWIFFKGNMFDLIAIIPLDKTFRIARLARLTRLARLSRMSRVSRISKISRLARVAIFAKKFMGGLLSILKTNGLHYMIVFTFVIIFGGAFGILYFESPYGNITSFGDALWWSMVTTTTVGYGDISPVSAGGRLLAALLMIAGIGFLGMVTGAIATFFLDKVVNNGSKNKTTIEDEQIQYVKDKLDKLDELSLQDIDSLHNIILETWKYKSQSHDK